jgi:peptidoglycan/LPS O-acetylase OafA/YrhL
MGTTAPDAPQGRVFHTLDALRGVAALGVVIYHLGIVFVPLAAPGGYLAVDLFFMMSGVVLCHAYEERFRAGMGVREFMRARLIRLYPLYLLGTLFGIAVTWMSLQGSNSQGWSDSSLLQSGAMALLMIPDFSGRPVNVLFPLNIPAWSLLLEILVNLAYVLLWPLLSTRLLLGVVLSGGAILCLALVQAGNLDQGSIAASFPVGLVRTVFGFSAGLLIARHARGRPRRESNAIFLIVVALVLIAITAWPEGQLRVIWDLGCAALLFPVIVYIGTMVDPGPRLCQAATFLGVTSYALYVLHSPVASILNSAIRDSAGGAGSAPFLGLAVAVVLLMGCWLVDRYYDIPVRRSLSRIVQKTRADIKYRDGLRHG